MNSEFLVTLATAFISFLVPAVFFTRFAAGQTAFNRTNTPIRSAFLPIAITLLPLTVAFYYFFYTPSNFIYALNIWQVALPLIFGLAIFGADYNKYLPPVLIILLGACVCTAVIPEAAIAAFLPLNPWLNRIILAAGWFLFGYAYRFVNSGDAMLPIQSITISSGIGILGWLNALPFILSAYGFMYTAAFAILLSFTWHPSRIGISKNSASAFGFSLFGLMAMAMMENCLACVLIFSMFAIVDTIWAVLYKLSFREEYANIAGNTAFQHALQEGLSPRQAASFAIRIQIVLIIFGCLQIYAPNQISLVILSVFLAIWLSYKLRSVAAPAGSLKDINRQVLEDLQDQVNNFKKYIKKDDDF